MKTTAWCSPRLLTLKFLGFFCPCRNHQIEDPSKDWDKGDDFRRCVIPVWQILWPDARCLPGHLWLHNPEQRARKALNIDLPPAPCFFSPMSEIHPSLRPPHSPPQVVPPPGQETMWHKSFCDESSSCLVDAWSGPPLAWAHSTVSPDPHCPSSSSCSALCERSDGRRAERSGCVLFMHAFWMALSTFHPCFGNLSFLIVLLYRCFLLFFGLLSSPAFVRFAFCSADKLCGGVSDHKCQ